MPNIIPNLIMAGDFNATFDRNSNHHTTLVLVPNGPALYVEERVEAFAKKS
jgi:hypothetical protein